MDNTKLIAEIRAQLSDEQPYAWPADGIVRPLLERCLDALEAADTERDSAWADGYNKAISQRLAASGSIEGNF